MLHPSGEAGTGALNAASLCGGPGGTRHVMGFPGRERLQDGVLPAFARIRAQSPPSNAAVKASAAIVR